MNAKLAKPLLSIYQKCKLCQINHKDKHNHVYSRSHQRNVASQLEKMKRKVDEARTVLKKPFLEGIGKLNVKTRTLEQEEEHQATNQLLMCSRLGIPIPTDALLSKHMVEETLVESKVWCCFCLEEVCRDMIMTDVIVKFGGLIEHLSSTEHGEKRDTYWKLHLVEKHHKLIRDQFSITSEDYDRFKVCAIEAIHEYSRARDDKLKEEAQKIRRTEMHQKRLALTQQAMLQQQSYREPQQSPWQPVSQSQSREPISRVRTIAAKGQGLKCINLKNVDDSVGNIHTGAAPPWFAAPKNLTNQKEEQNGGMASVGPDISDFNKHLEDVKRGKLPPDRVGARDRLTDDRSRSDWLPSFGRVWSKNARTQIRKQFMETKGKRPVSWNKSHHDQSHFAHQSTAVETRTSPEQEYYIPSSSKISQKGYIAKRKVYRQDSELYDRSSFSPSTPAWNGPISSESHSWNSSFLEQGGSGYHYYEHEKRQCVQSSVKSGRINLSSDLI